MIAGLFYLLIVVVVVHALRDKNKSGCSAFHILYTTNGIIWGIHSKMQVIEEQYHQGGMRLTVKANPIALERLHKMLQNIA